MKNLERVIFKGRVMNTVIDYTNRKILTLEKKEMHKHVRNRLQSIAKTGYKFSLEVLLIMEEELQKMSK